MHTHSIYYVGESVIQSNGVGISYILDIYM